MASKGGTYDPSKREASLQRQRMGLEQRVNDLSYKTGQDAQKLHKSALDDLNQGLGLLSQYLDSRIEGQKKQGKLYGKMVNEDSPKLYEQARMGAQELIGSMERRYKG